MAELGGEQRNYYRPAPEEEEPRSSGGGGRSSGEGGGYRPSGRGYTTTGTTTVDRSHPEVKALHKAGIPAHRIQQLAKIHQIDHPAISGVSDQQLAQDDPQLYGTDEKLAKEIAAANKTAAKSTKTKSDFVADPSTPSQYARDILQAAGLPDTPSNEALLERQMTEEGMPGSENNPLASTLPESGSSAVPGNPDDVQEYPSSLAGAIADAATLKTPAESAIFNALQSGKDTPTEYANALENSNYEGLGGSSNPNNVAYGQAYLGDSPATSFGSGGGGSQPISASEAAALQSAIGGGESGQVAAGQQIAAALPSQFFQNLANIIPATSSQQAGSSVQQALSGLNQGSTQNTLTANTSQAPGSPDQPNSVSQQTNVPNASQYQQALAMLLPLIRPGASANG